MGRAKKVKYNYYGYYVKLTPEYIAVSSDGTNRMMKSSDGITWNLVSIPLNQWQSITYSPTLKIWLAIANSGTNRIIYSDNTTDWTEVNIPARDWRSVIWGGDRFVAVSKDGYSLVSTDGITWNEYGPHSPLGSGIGSILMKSYKISYSSDLSLFFVTENEFSYSEGGAYSSDGITWLRRGNTNNDKTGYRGDSAWSPTLGLYVLTGSQNSTNNRYAYTSANPGTTEWVQKTISSGIDFNDFQAVEWGGDRFVAVGRSLDTNPFYTQWFVYSTNPNGPDFTSWTKVGASNRNDWNSISYSDTNNRFVAVAQNNSLDGLRKGDKIAYTTDGSSWITVTEPEDNSWKCVAWGGY